MLLGLFELLRSLALLGLAGLVGWVGVLAVGGRVYRVIRTFLVGTSAFFGSRAWQG